MPRPRIPRRRERILDAAQALILERGFDRTSMSALAERSGVGKGALYLEFGSKHELVDHLIARSMRRIVTAFGAQLETDGVTGLGDLYRVAADALLADSLLTAAFLDDQGILGGYVEERDDDRYRARFAWFDGYLRLLARDGFVRADIDLDALSLAFSAFTIGLLSLSRVVGPVDRERLDGTIRVFATLVDRAVTPEQTPELMSAEGSARLRALLDRLLAENERPESDDTEAATPERR